MATTWWKILVLQIFITIITRSTAFEPEGITKLSNENILWLFNNFLEDLKNQHAIDETNERTDQMRVFYRLPTLRSSRSKQNVEKSTVNEAKADDEPQLTSEDVQNDDNVENRAKKHYVTTLCHFKICNPKRSMDGYDNFIRYVTKKYNSQQF